MKRYFLYVYLAAVAGLFSFVIYHLFTMTPGAETTEQDTIEFARTSTPVAIKPNRPTLQVEQKSMDETRETPIQSAPQNATNTIKIGAQDRTATMVSAAKKPVVNNHRYQWQNHASPLQPVTNKPKLVIIIDDLGLNREATNRLALLKVPFTLAYLPYADDLASQTEQVRQAGHELLVHLPMEPASGSEDPGPNAMLTTLSDEEFDRRLTWNLSRFDGYIGVNNHMGSKFTASATHMMRVMMRLQREGLLFVDSLTTNGSYAKALSKELHMPHVARDIFLDNVRETSAIEAQLAKAVRIAEIRGYAIAIGHPYDVTLSVLEDMASKADSLSFELAPLSTIMAYKTGPKATD